jgi:N-acetylglutamate synthase-like GNAT family acetyltransferase
MNKGVNNILIDIKPRLDEPGIQELIGYSVFPDPDRLARVIQNYRDNHALEILGYESEGEIIGIVGCYMDQDKTLEIKHIAVIPEEREKGYGRGQILELIHMKKPNVLLAETDEESVEFYRNIGFEIISLGEKYTGAERFKCTYKTNE